MPKPVTASEVRKSIASQPEVVASLSEKAQHNLVSRGRLNPEVVSAFNKANPRGKYVEGAAKTVPLTVKHTQPSGKTVKKAVHLPEAEIRALAARAGVEVGARGPLPKSATLAASEQYVKEQSSVAKPEGE